MGWLEKTLGVSEAVSRHAILVGGLGVLAVTFLIGAEVLMRKFFGISTGGVDELSGYALAISFSWALSFTVLKRAHVRIDALYTRLPAVVRPLLDCLGIFSLTAFALVLAYFCLQVVLDTIELEARSNTTLGTPLWIPQLMWLSGLVLFSATCMILTVLAFAAYLASDREKVRALVGSRSTDEELAAESPGPRRGP